MKKEFSQYLMSIGMTEPLIKRVETIHEFYQGTCPEELTSIFVTDYLTLGGGRQYENLWFFSKKYVMEAKEFITKDDFDITPIQNRVQFLRVQKQDYDFKNAVEKSRLSLHFNLDTEVTGDFKASKENCDYLRDIIRQYILPNLK